MFMASPRISNKKRTLRRPRGRFRSVSHLELAMRSSARCGGSSREMLAVLKESPMKVRPLHDRVIVKRLDEEKKTAYGIVIPDTAAEKPDQGEVMSVGKGKLTDEGELVPLDVKIGDRVLFGKYSGQTVTLKGDELLVMREED